MTIDGQRLDRLKERAARAAGRLRPPAPEIPVGHERAASTSSLGRVAFHGVMRAPVADATATVSRAASSSDSNWRDFRHRDGASLSGGERQRMVLARALAQSTKVVVLDEPITGLDVRHQMDILEMLKKEVAECGLTVIATLHDLTLAGLFTDRLVLLHHGRGRASTARRTT